MSSAGNRSITRNFPEQRPAWPLYKDDTPKSRDFQTRTPDHHLNRAAPQLYNAAQTRRQTAATVDSSSTLQSTPGPPASALGATSRTTRRNSSSNESLDGLPHRAPHHTTPHHTTPPQFRQLKAIQELLTLREQYATLLEEAHYHKRQAYQVCVRVGVTRGRAACGLCAHVWAARVCAVLACV